MLREYRLAARLSQEMLAEQARISTEAVGALERGVRKLPQRQTLALLIEALQLEEHERARLSLVAVRPAQPRRRVDGMRSAVELLVERAAAASSAFTPADAVEPLARICDLLDDISSAIASAAAEVRMLDSGLRPQALAARPTASSDDLVESG